jgi:polysaccharide export outer membrane protein
MIKNITYLLLATLLSSCATHYKTIPYFQELSHTEITDEKVENFLPLTIQPSDILGISVPSRNPESSTVFNYRLSGGQGSDGSADNALNGYLVDNAGNIHLPLVGDLQVAGLTTAQLRDKLNLLLLTYYKDPVVSVKILNFKISVFGDVARPGIYTIPNERATITQALTLAGDLNITAIRTITLVRERDGKRTFIPIDLTSKKTFESPYYYLKNNDELYVQPDRTKYATVDRGYRTATLVLSGLSIIAIVLSNLFRR